MRIIMYRKLFYLVSVVFFFSVALTSGAKAADLDLVGWWRFNEGSGTTTADSSGLGNHGAFRGNPQWVAGKFSSALQFDGVDDFVEAPHNETLTVDNEVTVMAWINAERYIGPTGDDWQGILAKGESPSRSYSFYTERSGVLHFSAGGYGPLSTGQIPLNEMEHTAAFSVKAV